MGEYSIIAEGIAKRFGEIQALRGVSFNVPKGGVFCILGPNGAGKTTLLRILTTMTRPDSGTASLEGHDLHHHVLSVRHQIGVVAQENHFDKYLNVWNNLCLHAQLHGIGKSDYEKRIMGLLEKVGMADRKNAMPDELSGGQQRRIILIRALIHEPKILFLDEPTTGLDPKARREIWDTIEEMKKTSTVILTTHYMDEADQLSDQIMMLNHGEIVKQGTARELKRSISPLNRYELVLQNPKADVYLKTIEPFAKEIQKIHDYKIEFLLPDAESLKKILPKIDAKDFYRAGVLTADLESVFLSISEGTKEGVKA